MSFVGHTSHDRGQMLAALGLESLDDLFKAIPQELIARSFDIPEGLSEFEVMRRMRSLASRNATGLVNFVGAGFYDHFIPAAVNALAGLPAFYTAYTPYQPEASQGWLQAIYEYQTAVCELTGLDAANASLYDGGTALYEAAMMALRLTRRRKIIMDSGVNLLYRSMLYTYTSNLGIEFVETPVCHGQSCREEIARHLDGSTAAVIVQNPNFFGAVDDLTDIARMAHDAGALLVASVYPLALGMLKTPAEMDVDIATGEGQSLGIPLSFGGPYLGFMAARTACLRQMPGRIVGATVDKDSKTGFVLTLQTREQHIRREKATSNICSNEALCALRALIFLTLAGRSGLRSLAKLNYDKAEFAKSALEQVPGIVVKRSAPTFNEFTLLLPSNAEEICHGMIRKGFAPGFPLGRYYKGMDNYLLVAVTEKRTREEIMGYAQALEALVCS